MLKFVASDQGFMPPEKETFPPAESQAVIIPFGLEKTVSYEGGTAQGPQAIIDASQELEYFDDVFWSEPRYAYGIGTLEAAKINADIVIALDEIESVVAEVLDAGKFPLVLGGEHSLTAGAIRPFVSRFDTITLLQFDAHADLRDGYEGEHFSHASAMCRCLDYDNVRLVAAGIRNISAGEVPFLEANKGRIDIFWARDKAKWNAEQIADAVGDGPVYLTFDLDGFDSSLMPATGTPEPGGLFWDETIEIISAVSKRAKIVGADVVELAPREGLHACDFLTAKLVYKILSYALLPR